LIDLMNRGTEGVCFRILFLFNQVSVLLFGLSLLLGLNLACLVKLLEFIKLYRLVTSCFLQNGRCKGQFGICTFSL
jgi:hypothetical protein